MKKARRNQGRGGEAKGQFAIVVFAAGVLLGAVAVVAPMHFHLVSSGANAAYSQQNVAGSNSRLRASNPSAHAPLFLKPKTCKSVPGKHYEPSRYGKAKRTQHRTQRGNYKLDVLPSGIFLGLNNWKLHGSKAGTSAATSTFLSQGYHRITITTVPRSGNTWLRQLIEQITGVATGSVYEEGGRMSDAYGAYFPSQDSPCGGTSFAHAGSFLVKHTHANCITQVKYPQIPREPVVIKDHAPWGSFNFPALLVNNTFYVVLVRNPIDNWRACLGYYQLKPEDTIHDREKCFRLRKFVDR